MSHEHISENRSAITSVVDHDDRSQELGQPALPENEHLQAFPTIWTTRPSSDRFSFDGRGNIYRVENHRSRNVSRQRVHWHEYSVQSTDNTPATYESQTPSLSLIDASVRSGGSCSGNDAKEVCRRRRKPLSRVVAGHYRAVSDPISARLSNTFGSIRRRVASLDKRSSRPTSTAFAAQNHGQHDIYRVPRGEDGRPMLLGVESPHPEERCYINAAHLPFTPFIYPDDPASALYSQPNRTFYHTVDNAIAGEGNVTGLPNITQRSTEDVHLEPLFLPPVHPSTELRERRAKRPPMAAYLWRIAGRAERRHRQYRTSDSSQYTGQVADPHAVVDRRSNSIYAFATDAHLTEMTSRMSIYDQNPSDLPDISDWNTAPPPVPPHRISPSAADTNFKSHLIDNPNPFWHPDDDEQDSQNESDSASSSGNSLRGCDSNFEDQPEKGDGCNVADVEIGRVGRDCVSAPISLSETEYCPWEQEMDLSSDNHSIFSFPESWSMIRSEDMPGSPDPSFASLDVPHREYLSTKIRLRSPSDIPRPRSGWLSQFWERLRGFCMDDSDHDLPYQHLSYRDPALSRTTSFLDAVHDQLFSPPGLHVISDPDWEEGSDTDSINHAQANHSQDCECTFQGEQSTYEEAVSSLAAADEGSSFHAQAQLEDTGHILRQSSQPMHATGNPDNSCRAERAATESPTAEYDREWNETPPVTIDHAYSTDGSETWRDCSISQLQSVNPCLEAEQRPVVPLVEDSLRSRVPICGRWEVRNYLHCENQPSIIPKTRHTENHYETFDKLFDNRSPVRRPRIAKGSFCPKPRIMHYNSPLKALHLPSIDLDEFMKSHKIGRSAAGTWAQPRTKFPAEFKSMTSHFQGARPGWLTEGHWVDDVAYEGDVCARAEKQQRDGNKTNSLVPSLPSTYSTWQCGLPQRFAGHWALEQDWKSAGSSSYSGVIALRHAGRRRERTTAANGGVFNSPCDT